MASSNQFGSLNINVEPATRIRGPPPDAYKNDTSPRGAFFIANWKTFENDEDYPERHGSEKDVENLKILFTQSGYKFVGEIWDSSRQKCLEELKSIRENVILKSVDSFVGIFMSHGTSSALYSNGGEEIHVNEICDVFNNYDCPSLQGKPKIFILQHCRGSKTTAICDPPCSIDGRSFEPEVVSVGLCRLSDIYLCSSTLQGYVSYRHITNGSFFIEHFCRVFMKFAKDTEIFCLIPKINKNLSATRTLQVCDFQAIYNKHMFYFNPTKRSCDEKPSTSKEAQDNPVNFTRGASFEGAPREGQTSTSSGTFSSTSSDSDPCTGKSGNQRTQDQLPFDVSSADEIYELNENNKGWVFMINNINGCEDDVDKLEALFTEIGYGVKRISEVQTYSELKENIQQHFVYPSTPVVVFFFGYGFGENIFIGRSENESLSYRRFCQDIRMYMEERKALVLFTNTYFKARTRRTFQHSESDKPVEDTFHFCVKIDGDCNRGSLLTKALLQQLKESGITDEIYTFTRQISCKIYEMQEMGPDSYHTGFRCYGINRFFYFSSPLEREEVYGLAGSLPKSSKDTEPFLTQSSDGKEKKGKNINEDSHRDSLCEKPFGIEAVTTDIQDDAKRKELIAEGSAAEIQEARSMEEAIERPFSEIQRQPSSKVVDLEETAIDTNQEASRKRIVAESSVTEMPKHQGIGSQRNSDGTDGQKEFLQKLGLFEYFPEKISLQIAMQKSSGKREYLADLPWYLITKMLMLDYRGRDDIISEAIRENLQTKKTLSRHDELGDECDRFFEDLIDDVSPSNSGSSAPHPLDVLIAVFRCSSNFLRQTLCEKMFMCKLSIPLVLPPFLDSETILLLWSMRNIVLESESSRYEVEGHQEATEEEEEPNRVLCQSSAVKMPTPVVACLRLGEIAQSKSKFLNEILSSDGHPTFYHRDCQNGLNNRFMADGLIEVAWHLPSKKTETIDHQDKTVAFLNLRGDGISQETSRTFMSQVANVVMVMVDICTLGRDNIIETFRNLTSNGAELLLIITKQSNVSITRKNKEDLKRCVEAVESNFEKQNIILDFNGRKNIEDLKKETTTKLRNCLKGETLRRRFQSFEEIANLLHVPIDENTPECSAGHTGALEVVKMALDGGKDKLKTKKLPLQCVPWQEWSKLNKEEHRREKNCGDELLGYMDKIYKEKKHYRNEQRRIIMEPNLLFDAFLRYLLDFKGEERLYFLKWLKLYLDDKSREILPGLQMECTMIWDEIRLYEAGTIEKEKLLDLQRELATMERNLADSSFGLEHFIREIAQAFEAFNDTEKIDFEGVQKRISGLPRIMAELMLLGFPLELMDGDAANVPLSWIKAVLKQLRELIGKTRIFVLSVLGIQSSGKSTMLNTMFGLQFAVAAGRCTRGVYAQLVPLSKEYSNEKYDYILVVDTEGLRAPELGDEKLQHDNEIATLVIGLGDVTLVNIKGENTSEMEDVLQIVIHALLKMKLVNTQLTLQPSCFFIHHNVPSPDATQKLRSGQQKFLETLDKVTKVAGKQEDAPEFTKFSQVIEFDINDNVSYFSDLWKGDPPMAPVNPGYSENVNTVKQSLLTNIIKKRTTHLDIRKFSTKLEDLWNGILDQNFVFSFKNNLEIEAYSSLDDKLSDLLWSLKKAALEWQSDKENEIVSSEHEIEKLRNSLTSECHDYLTQRYTTAELNLQDIFKTDEDQSIINQWRSRTFKRLDDCYHDCISRTTDDISSKLKVRQIQINQRKDMQKYQANIMEEAKKVAENLLQRENGQNLSEETLEANFNAKWKEWITKLPQNYEDNINIQDRVDKVFYDKFFQDIPVVKKVLGDLQIEDVNTIRSNFDEAVEKYVSRKYALDILVNKKKITCDSRKKLFADISGFVEETKSQGFRAGYAQKIIEWTDAMIRRFTKSRLTINDGEEFRISVLICTCQFASSEYSKKCRIDIASDRKYKMGRFGIHPYFEQELSKMFSSKLMPLLHKSQRRSLRKFPIKLDEHVLHQGNMENLETQRYVETLVSVMYDDVESYVRKSEIQEFRDEYVEEIIKMVIDRVDKDKFVSFKKNFKIQLAVYVCYFALPTFCENHKRYTDNINPRKIFKRDYYGTYFQLFKNSYNRITNETALSLLLSERLSKAIENAVDKDMARELADDVRNNVPEIRNKPAFLQAVLLQLLEEDNFEDFYLYLADTNSCFEKWIMYYTDNYLFPKDGNNQYSEIASRMISSLISKVCKEISRPSLNIPKELSAEEVLQEWIKEFQKRVMDKLPIPLHDLLSLVDGYDILALDSFTNNLEKNLRVSEKKIKGIFQKHTKEHLRSAHEDSVYKVMFQECKGCTEKCPLCSAPCTLNREEHLKDGINHMAKEHYPQGCGGRAWDKNKKLVIENCSIDVASERDSFKSKKTKGEFHPYKNYREIYPEWLINGDPSVESSPYWKWVLVNYESQFAERHEAERPDIPSSWSSITKEMAGNSVKKFTSSS